MYKQEDILRETDGGLKVIIDLFPNAADGTDQKKKFKMRGDEKTASAKLQRKEDGTWIITDFGGDGKGKNAISLVMEEKSLSFADACTWIGERFGLENDKGFKALQFKMDSRPSEPGESEGLMTFARRDKFTLDELKVVFAENLISWVETLHNADNGPTKKTERDPYQRCHEILKRYGWTACDSYTLTSKGKTRTIHSSKDYPIFIMEDESGSVKIIKPKEKEKQYRFMYYHPNGPLSNDHVWGLKQAKEELKKRRKAWQEENQSEAETTEAKKASATEPKLPEIIVVSGDRDSMNVALMGYFPVWQNSETKGISGQLYKTLYSLADKVMNLPDIDLTGMEQGVKAALQHIDLLTIWLPFELLSQRDWRGNPCKDLRDFLSFKDRWRKKDFDGLVKTAKRCRFWHKTIQRDKQGKQCEDFEISSVEIQHFLWCSGFYKRKSEASKDGYQYIQINGHVVREVDAKQIRNYVKQYLESKHAEHKLLNKFMRSTILNDSAMEYLQEVEIDFSDHTKNNQLLFLQNEVWDVRADKIERISTKNAAKAKYYVWEKEVIPHRVDLMPPYFESFINDEGDQLIKINSTDNIFFQYLIATCRIHWRKEEKEIQKLSDEEQIKYWEETRHMLNGGRVADILDQDEQNEQLKHLANKLFAIGYMLHRFKDPSRPWGIYAMDAKLSDEGMSFGRSGKSLFFKGLRELLIAKTIPGRNVDITKNPHIYDGVTPDTDMILVDDCNQWLKYDFFFTSLTDTLLVNGKHTKEFEISYSDSPKIVFTSNFALNNPDPSLQARLLFMVFSDFFHEKTEETDYLQSRSPREYLGKNLFGHEFTDQDWNSFLNLCAQSIQFYLSCDKKLSPPMKEVNLRANKAEMGDVFYDWAEVYFSKENSTLDVLIPKEKALEEFISSNKNNKWTTHKFTKAMKAYVKFKQKPDHIFILNPKDLLNGDGRLIRKFDNKSTECIYLQTQVKINDSFEPKTFEEFTEEAFDNKADF